MTTSDPLSLACADLLDGQYDCVDRIILNAYFPLGCRPGGFRTWWRELFGNDDDLDNTHLMRWAGRFSRRLRGWASKNGIPVLDCSAGERKHDLAEKYLPADRTQTGIFLVLVNRAPAPVWDVARYGQGGLHLQRKQPWVNHYTFHIWDHEWGHVAIRMCGHPPFSALVMLNGHELVTSGCQQQGLLFRKEGNCFTSFADAPGLQQVADTLRTPAAVGRLRAVAERWLYRCVCLALDSADQERTGFRYELSVYQLEYSRNLLFNCGRELEQFFQGLIDRTRATLDIKTIKTILGCKQRPQKQGKTRWEITVETPEYGLTIFKVPAGALTLKLYTKGERVLRCEVMLHNARKLRLGTVLERWPNLLGHLQGVLERFLTVLRCADRSAIDDGTWDALPQPSQVGASRVAGVQVTSERLGVVMATVVALATQPGGFTSGEVATRVRQRLRDAVPDYQTRQAAYDLKKLRGKGLVEKVPGGRRYQSSPAGLRTLVAVGVLRDKVFKPVLHNRNTQGQHTRSQDPLDQHYHNLRQEMRRMFQTLNIDE